MTAKTSNFAAFLLWLLFGAMLLAVLASPAHAQYASPSARAFVDPDPYYHRVYPNSGGYYNDNSGYYVRPSNTTAATQGAVVTNSSDCGGVFSSTDRNPRQMPGGGMLVYDWDPATHHNRYRVIYDAAAPKADNRAVTTANNCAATAYVSTPPPAPANDIIVTSQSPAQAPPAGQWAQPAYGKICITGQHC